MYKIKEPGKRLGVLVDSLKNDALPSSRTFSNDQPICSGGAIDFIPTSRAAGTPVRQWNDAAPASREKDSATCSPQNRLEASSIKMNIKIYVPQEHTLTHTSSRPSGTKTIVAV